MKINIRYLTQLSLFYSLSLLLLTIPARIFSQVKQPVKKNPYSADLGNGYYLNPILKGDYGDPTVVRDGDDYYMTNHSPNFPSMLIWHSKDLVNWEPLNYALQENLGVVWAADLIKYKGLFYMYLPVPSKNTNYVITAPHPTGPWSRAVDLKVSGIDPGHIAGADGKRYLHLDNGYIVELSADGLTVISEKKKVYDGWKYPDDWVTECFCLESPKITYHSGYYYLTVAQGGTAGPPTGHMVVSARSKNPWGPWENSPYNPIIRNNDRNNKWASIGHGTLVDSPDGKWWMIFHGFEQTMRTLGRQTLMLPIEWTKDGWYKVPDNIDIAKPIKKPIGSAVSNHLNLSDDFSDTTLGIQWKMKESTRNRIRLADKSLIIKAEGNSPMDSSFPAFTPVNEAFEVKVEVNTAQKSKGGLTFSSGRNYNGLELDQNTIYVLTGNGNRTKWKDIGNADHVYLKLVDDHEDIICYFSTDDIHWEKYYLITNVSNWGVLHVGLYSTGEGETVFKGFKYNAL